MAGSDRKIEQNVSRDTALSAVLHRRADIETQMRRDGITLLVPGRSLIPGRRKRRRLELDETGRTVWEAADGKTPVRQILRRIAAGAGRSEESVERSLFAFLKQMTTRGLLALTVTVEGGDEASAATASS